MDDTEQLLAGHSRAGADNGLKAEELRRQRNLHAGGRGRRRRAREELGDAEAAEAGARGGRRPGRRAGGGRPGRCAGGVLDNILLQIFFLVVNE